MKKEKEDIITYIHSDKVAQLLDPETVEPVYEILKDYEKPGGTLCKVKYRKRERKRASEWAKIFGDPADSNMCEASPDWFRKVDDGLLDAAPIVELHGFKGLVGEKIIIYCDDKNRVHCQLVREDKLMTLPLDWLDNTILL